MTTLEIVNALQSAHTLLLQADRDYDGHRALAANEVEKALKGIGRHTAAKVPAATPANPPATANPSTTAKPATTAPSSKRAAAAAARAEREAQSNSDAQLRQAQLLLQQALMHVNARHPKLAANVQAAIGEINTALAIK
jgi:hypothetical protein